MTPHLNKLQLPSPKIMLCAKFGWNCISGSEKEEKIFYISSMYFGYFVIISPWKSAGPSFKKNIGDSSHVRLKLAQWLLRRNILVCSLFCYYFSMEKGRTFLLNEMNCFHLRMLYSKFDRNWPCGSRKEDENVKSFRQRRTTYKFRSEKLRWAKNFTWGFGSDELKQK